MQSRALATALFLFGFVVLLGVLTASGCSTAYYGAMEQIGQHKRDILKSRIKAGRQDQKDAQEQFKTTYERFAEAANFDGGDLESVYNRLNREFERSEARAQDVSDRIVSIEKVSADLFAEWKRELDLIQNPKLRSASAQSLRTTQTRYRELIAAMKRAEAKMPPVLAAFREQAVWRLTPAARAPKPQPRRQAFSGRTASVLPPLRRISAQATVSIGRFMTIAWSFFMVST